KKDANGNYYRFDTGQFNYRKVDGQRTPTLIETSGYQFGPAFSSLDKIEGYDGKMTSYRAYPNNWENAYQNGISSRTNITLSGGGEEFTFYVNGAVNVNKGIHARQQLNKYSGMLKASYDFSDYLTVKGSVNYIHSVPENPPHNIGDDYAAYAFSRAYPTKKYKDESVFEADHGGVPSNAFGDQYANVPANSIWFSIYNNTDRRIESTWTPILNIRADVTEWLTLSLGGSMNIFNYTAATKELGQGYRNEGGYYSF